MAMSPFRRGGGGGFWDPLSEVNRMFDDVFGGLTRRPGSWQPGGEVTEWAPAVDVLQRDGDLVVRAEQRGGYHVRERRHGSFSRSMTVPEGVNEDSIWARYENGVLEVSIQGAAAVREPRRIQIEGANGSGAATDVAQGLGAENTRAEGGATLGGATSEEGPRTEGLGATR